MPSISDRCEAASLAIDAHRDATRDHDSEDIEQLIDLMCNLRHWSHERGLNFAEACRVSNDHFKAELIQG